MSSSCAGSPRAPLAEANLPLAAPETFGAIVGMTLLAVTLDAVWKHARDRTSGRTGETVAPDLPG